MVRLLICFFLTFSFSYSNEIDFLEEVIVEDDPLTKKVKSFLDKATYDENQEFINVIFEPKSSFYVNNRVDSVKVVQTLKENGLLELFFKSPRELRLNFKTSGSPLFFVKIMEDTLRNIGYYRYVTVASNLDASEFTWNINLMSEYVTDPLILQQELAKSGCKIIDLQRNSQVEWTYIVDMVGGYLNVTKVDAKESLTLKHSIYVHWLDVSEVASLEIQSSRRNRWYPDIAYYDASLHLLKVVKKETIHKSIRLNIPQTTKYIKVGDLYTLKNIKDELVVYPIEVK
ncbi:hypothetical protein GJV85_11760 [Sulfurimonas aquatica]|uniref:Periplasmic protein n=1 Tax=Sulfurimonas aquatica TaxID=2672570 RepID=A0A975B247_9BACT|nr:hypothetical protein [Sulfurimonas aquatica]QSZ42760.1 hypothetical protein GJV85_11760 [Sulfurimonas aquatica]